MKTLVDSSVWIAHFKNADDQLIALLEADEVLIHPFIIQELYLGKPKGKDFVFERLSKLPQLPILSTEQFFSFCDENKISGKGVGCIDTHLLAAAHLHNVALYTLDKNLRKLAKALR